MTSKDKLLTEISELKYSIQNNDFNVNDALTSLNKIDNELNDLDIHTNKNNIIKSFIITFNVSNFSDLTILFISTSDNIRIIEYAGDKYIFDEIKTLFEQEKEFFKDVDKFQIKGNNYRIFYEAMANDNGIYTVLTLTESVFFKPTRFHILCDILMDIIRSTDLSVNSVFNDLFEDTIINLNSYIGNNNITKPEFYFFKFENINDFFLKMGFEILIELSETIINKISEVFGEKSGIFKISFSRYIVITSDNYLPEYKISELNNRSMFDFSYKGIVLQHRCIKIPYNKNNSIYDIFENIYSNDSGPIK